MAPLVSLLPTGSVPPLMTNPPAMALFGLSRMRVPPLTVMPPPKSSPPVSVSVTEPVPCLVKATVSPVIL